MNATRADALTGAAPADAMRTRIWPKTPAAPSREAADPARAVATYRMVLRISIILNLLVGVFILFWPSTFAELLGQPEPHPTAWPSHWGAQLIAINLLYLPGYWRPLQNRWPNILGVAIRVLFAVFFFIQGDGFIWMGLYDGLFGILLWVTYWRAWRADLMSKP